MQKSVRRIMLLSCMSLLIGIIIAYYNTSSLGYDNANIISFNNEGIYLFDIDIKYKNIREFNEKIEKLLPKDAIAI